MADAPDTDPADVLSAALAQLAEVVQGLRRHQEVLHAVDPARHSLELARVRAEATGEVLAAQQIAAQASEEASTLKELLGAERTESERRHAALTAELDAARTDAHAANERLVDAQAVITAAEVAHAAELDQRDQTEATAAADHDRERNKLIDELNQARLAFATSQARADSADHNAAAAEAAARDALARGEHTRAENTRLNLALAEMQATIGIATARADTAERLLAEARADLRLERERNDAHLAQLHDQVTALASRRSPKRTPRAKPNPPSPKPATGPQA